MTPNVPNAEAAAPSVKPLDFVLDGQPVQVEGVAGSFGHGSLLEVLRDRLGVRSVKDGCSPQGQCGCCTVWVDGQPRVACVTPAERIAGRAVTTIDALPDGHEWAQRLCDSGGSQCGFCTPGIVMRLAAIPEAQRSPDRVKSALLAHVCRCTGWQTIVEAACAPSSTRPARRSVDAAAQRATIEGRAAQRVGPDVALGRGGFASDSAPADAWHAVRDAAGEWHVAPTLTAARAAAGKVQGRRTTAPLTWPLEVPDGEWVRTLCTTWVEPGYLEPDAAWCEPGGDPVAHLGNGGGFGSKPPDDLLSLGLVARRLADECGHPVIVAWSREDVVRFGAKRPPFAGGRRADGTGLVRVARTPGVAAAIASVAPGLVVEEVDVLGPRTSVGVRGAGWVEAAVLAAGDDEWIQSPDGARAHAQIDASPTGIARVRVSVQCGDPLDEVVLRSYCIGAAHMALGWVRSEAIAVDELGEPLDLTMRSFGVIRAVDTPEVVVEIVDDPRAPLNGSDAVLAAVASAAWRHGGFAPRWPTMRS